MNSITNIDWCLVFVMTFFVIWIGIMLYIMIHNDNDSD